MKKVKLAKALKIKNSLITQLNQAKGILNRENSRLVKSTSQVNREETYKLIQKLLNDLVEVKSKIAKANTGIYEKIERMAELKSMITFLNSLDTTDGAITKTTYQHVYEETYTAFLKVADIDAKITALTKEIENAQDEIDEYNATHEIELSDSIDIAHCS